MHDTNRATNRRSEQTDLGLLHFNDEGLQTDVAIFDFSKAFDTVPHEELLCKLKRYGITGSIHDWLRTFLTKRHM